jgi:hypothetical protein
MFTRNLEMSEFAPSAPAPSLVRSRTMRCPDRYELNVATAYYDRPDILDAWHRMLATAASPEALYQSPQFFNHLIAMQQGKDANYELFIVRRSIDYAIVGFVPVRTIECGLEFRVGPAPLFKRTMRACQILGSVPLLDQAEEGIVEFVMQQLLKRFAKCDVLYMQAVPEDTGAALDGIAGVSSYVLNGWRTCHTQPLPDGVDSYLQKFSSKKRYNLSRQVRLLTEAAGALQVMRIEQPEQVPALLDAMVAMDTSPDGERDAEQARLESLARQGLLLSYVIRCGDEDVAFVYGSHSASVWHVHKIICQQKYLHLSVGTSAIHLAVQDVLAHFAFKDIDFGYGTPNSEFRSTHVLKTRGLVLLHRARSGTALLLKAHGIYNAMNDALIRQVKRAQKWHAQRRQTAKKIASKADKAPTVS